MAKPCLTLLVLPPTPGAALPSHHGSIFGDSSTGPFHLDHSQLSPRVISPPNLACPKVLIAPVISSTFLSASATQALYTGSQFTSQSLCILVWASLEADAETRISVQVFIWELIPGKTCRGEGNEARKGRQSTVSLESSVPRGILEDGLE